MEDSAAAVTQSPVAVAVRLEKDSYQAGEVLRGTIYVANKTGPAAGKVVADEASGAAGGMTHPNHHPQQCLIEIEFEGSEQASYFEERHHWGTTLVPSTQTNVFRKVALPQVYTLNFTTSDMPCELPIEWTLPCSDLPNSASYVGRQITPSLLELNNTVRIAYALKVSVNGVFVVAHDVSIIQPVSEEDSLGPVVLENAVRVRSFIGCCLLGTVSVQAKLDKTCVPAGGALHIQLSGRNTCHASIAHARVEISEQQTITIPGKPRTVKNWLESKEVDLLRYSQFRGTAGGSFYESLPAESNCTDDDVIISIMVPKKALPSFRGTFVQTEHKVTISLSPGHGFSNGQLMADLEVFPRSCTSTVAMTPAAVHICEAQAMALPEQAHKLL